MEFYVIYSVFLVYPEMSENGDWRCNCMAQNLTCALTSSPVYLCGIICVNSCSIALASYRKIHVKRKLVVWK